ncbi:hypothetical protein K505DRAFT_238939 [Melanomma pulvis-pyrius CBS 109.77]|uniref:PAS domain-containing protein n=1 Tax=Melanomma pulvis-pyrius CBS 109.77 TaxID=1314802 RepID=A0A6A6XHP0_9PLEO|nr:hypothetical protein K505DRAFT_238939 [Melanomma pulvis-pyrius CBS 109.77]
MDTTFITIHDLSEGAHILYSSDSIVDILGHTPDEVVNRSAWDFFHDEDKPLAQQFHLRGVKLDKAAVLAYCRIKNRHGEWVGCECCFSIVYDVMVCCISIYRHGMSSQKRAVEAPIVRRLFASSPKDPRYHMLSHLSSKFTLGPDDQTHEPRAALFLNRFTRTLTVMYATSGIEQIIGISSEAMKGRSFYSYIQDSCLADAVRCLESAKGNDSIAYMRFFFTDPRDNEAPEESTSESEDDIMTDVVDSEDESGGGTDRGMPFTSAAESSNTRSNPSNNTVSSGAALPQTVRADSGDSTQSAARSSTSSLPFGSPPSERLEDRIELEAVVSCTSDGLVVCLRRARPAIPTAMPAAQPAYPNGIFAAPWAPEPVFAPSLPQQPPFPLGARHPDMMAAGGHNYHSDFMQSIRDVAVFAWALTGINGSLAEYSRGNPVGESQPPDGFPIWDPAPREKLSAAPSGYVSGTSSSSGGRNDPFGDPGLS